MTWTKGPKPNQSAGDTYYSAASIVWRKDAPPLCKYIIQRVANGKGYRWLLYQWLTEAGRYELVPNTEKEPCFTRLYHAKERADWITRKDLRAGMKSDHSTPIEAAAEAFSLCLKFGENSTEGQS